jgi:hypothetical protein
MRTVIIYGDSATGKTRRREEFKLYYGCSRIVDGWDGRTKLQDGDLALTNLHPPFNVPGATVVDIAKAKYEIALRN